MGEKVGIVLAAYNSQDFIREQLDSILLGDYKDIHIYVRDDGSADHTVSIVKGYVEKYPSQVELVENKENMGLVRNFLAGAMEAEEDYIMFSDHDDVWLPCKVRKTLAAMKKAERGCGKGHMADCKAPAANCKAPIANCKIPIAVFTDAAIVDKDLNPMGISFYEQSHFNMSQMGLSYMLMENKLIGCSIMINKPLQEKLTALPRHARVHDWWLALIASAFGKIVFVQEETLLYRQHGSNQVGSKSYGAYVKEAAKSLRAQKRKLLLTERQAAEFYQIYKGQLKGRQRKVVYEFARLEKGSFFQKRRLILKNKYLKSGFARNIGVLLVV